jgi:transposase
MRRRPVGRACPGIYFRLLLTGYFEGIDSERGIAWRAADSLALRDFLGVGSGQRGARPLDDFAHASADRSGNTSRRHVGVAVLSTAGLVKGKTIGIDATTLEANAALRSIVRRELRGVSDDARESLGHRDPDAR